MLPPHVARRLAALLFLLALSAASAQGLFGRAAPPERWATLAAELSTFGQGAMVGYGQEALFGDNADARFSVAYTVQAFSGELGAELAASALSYTYRPDGAQPQLFLMAYGGVGPRLLVQGGVYDFMRDVTSTAVALNVGALGGLEARLQRVGLFLELQLSLPAVGLVGSNLTFFPLPLLTVPKLSLGTNVYF
ncbi:hypothetical protein [Truepera radiovictrix]|uniref:Outer membrane protein beta-barrel domain-containing protein n=1 Tax=Truepera radiovictrix (strain DSM 17093 / CIP 108686 / LMG 22925 / RQ-24) TaxID=649638 RepID=D7CRB3_TRURR|nr:hypothetical protein [Truepera radiovictrix]ADI15201.1 hypothetical protein Trad_2087 [Truepera radiovictrix DSM 17093]WMT56248.1 hypothetical protein RCV51_09545 [Truepera radiovictrix]